MGYIVAWVIAVIAGGVFLKTAHIVTTGTSVAAFGTTPASAIAWLVVGISSLVMLVMVIGALVALGQRHAWGWFVAVLVLQIVGLGIVGMVAYAVAGPSDRTTQSFTRPSVT